MTIPVDETWLKANERERSALISDNDALRARVRTLEGALGRMLNERGCSGCVRADHAPPYVRGKNTRLAADEHTGDCANLAALAALSGAQPASPAQAPKRKPTEADGFRRRCTVCNQMADECVCPAGAQPDTTLAEREASIVELRRALETLMRVHGAPWPEEVHTALAQPAPQAALRAILVKAIKEATKDCGRDCGGTDDYESTADAVLKGES